MTISEKFRTNLENVVDDEVARNNNEQQAHVDPAEETKLSAELIAFQVRNESYEAEYVEHERNEAMMTCEWNEVCINEDNVLQGRCRSRSAGCQRGQGR